MQAGGRTLLSQKRLHSTIRFYFVFDFCILFGLITDAEKILIKLGFSDMSVILHGNTGLAFLLNENI